MQSQRLYRSKSDRMIAGVCGGLAKYFSVDSTLVRLVFLLVLFLGGAGFLVYLILWIIMPEEDRITATPHETVQANAQDLADTAQQFGNSLGQAVGSSSADAARTAARQGPILFGIILVALGGLFLLQNLLHIDFGQLWPVILIVIGLAMMVLAWRRSPP